VRFWGSNLGQEWSFGRTENIIKNVVKITTEIGVSWGKESKLSGKRQYVRVRKIMAGKFHRYAGWKWNDYFEHFDLTCKDLILGNILGFLGFIGGILQSFVRLFTEVRRVQM